MIDLTCPITEVAALIPHSGEMVLLDAITEVDGEHLIAETYLRADNFHLYGRGNSRARHCCLGGLSMRAGRQADWLGVLAWFASFNATSAVYSGWHSITNSREIIH